MDFEHLLDATISGLGYELVEWALSGKAGMLRIFIDKPGGISVDDCAHISQHLSRVLDGGRKLRPPGGVVTRA
jgi:ribosome maturation factor RimP